MNKLAFACEKSIDRLEILNTLRGCKNYDVLEYRSINEIIGDFESNQINGLVLGLNQLSTDKIEVLNSVRKVTKENPLIFVCNNISGQLRQGPFGHEKSIFFMNIEEIVHLPGVLNKIFSNQKVIMRKHIRYPVNLSAVAYSEGLCQPVSIKNISKGGVLLKNTGSHFRESSSFWIEFPSQVPEQPHLRQVSVSWRKVAKQDTATGDFFQLVGCKFSGHL